MSIQRANQLIANVMAAIFQGLLIHLEYESNTPKEIIVVMESQTKYAVKNQTLMGNGFSAVDESSLVQAKAQKDAPIITVGIAIPSAGVPSPPNMECE